MALAALGPFALTGIAQSITVVESGQFSAPREIGQILLCNNSGYTLQLISSSDGQLANLNPGNIVAIDPPRNGGALTAVVLTGSPGNPSPQLTAQVGLAGETFDGAYPATIAQSPGPLQPLGVFRATQNVIVTPSQAALGILVYAQETLLNAAQMVETYEGLPSPTYADVSLPVVTLSAPGGAYWSSYYVPVCGAPQTQSGEGVPFNITIFTAQVALSFSAAGTIGLWEVDVPIPLPS